MNLVHYPIFESSIILFETELGAYDGDIKLKNLTASDLRASSSEAYGNLMDGPLDVNSTLEQVFRGKITEYGNYLDSKLTPEQRQLLYSPNTQTLQKIIKL